MVVGFHVISSEFPSVNRNLFMGLWVGIDYLRTAFSFVVSMKSIYWCGEGFHPSRLDQ